MTHLYRNLVRRAFQRRWDAASAVTFGQAAAQAVLDDDARKAVMDRHPSTDRLDSDEALRVVRACVKCRGYGSVHRWHDDDLIDVECPACMGSGRDADRICRKAGGEGL